MLQALCCFARAGTGRVAVAPLSLTRGSLLQPRRRKGDYGFNVFHNSNPQHGGSYARHERRMRDDEVEDFLRSVKGWSPVLESFAAAQETTVAAQPGARTEEPPPLATREMGEEAIQRTFCFHSFNDAYLFMGRVWAFCYGTDKYPHITWDNLSITVYLYSPSFRGLSKREARVAAFLNDQYNMLRKSKVQQEKLINGPVKQATVEEVLGDAVARTLAEREARRRAPLQEVREGPTHWESLLKSP